VENIPIFNEFIKNKSGIELVVTYPIPHCNRLLDGVGAGNAILELESNRQKSD
jgi:hypothetical protein